MSKKLGSAAMLVAADGTVIDPTGARAYNISGAVVVAVGTTSSAVDAMPTLGETGEVMVHSDVACAIALGAAGVGPAVMASTPMRLEAGERFHFRPTSTQTNFRVIGTSAGVLRLVPVA